MAKKSRAKTKATPARKRGGRDVVSLSLASRGLPAGAAGPIDDIERADDAIRKAVAALRGDTPDVPVALKQLDVALGHIPCRRGKIIAIPCRKANFLKWLIKHE
jgi:hypothetical protein